MPLKKDLIDRKLDSHRDYEAAKAAARQNAPEPKYGTPARAVYDSERRAIAQRSQEQQIHASTPSRDNALPSGSGPSDDSSSQPFEVTADQAGAIAAILSIVIFLGLLAAFI